MEFAVNRNALLNELNMVQGVIEKKSTIPILSNILLDASGDRVDITATDLDVSICCGCPGKIQNEGTMTISARRIFDIVRLLPEDAEIEFFLLENDWVRVHSGNSEYKVVGLPKENFGKKRGGKRVYGVQGEGRVPAGETAGKPRFRPKHKKKSAHAEGFQQESRRGAGRGKKKQFGKPGGKPGGKRKGRR